VGYYANTRIAALISLPLVALGLIFSLLYASLRPITPDPAFQQIWERTDKAVFLNGSSTRPWLWGLPF
jgi:hypothetical protein